RGLDPEPPAVAADNVARYTRQSGRRLPFDAPKPDVAHARIDGLRSACRGAVAQAVVVGAQERTALDDLARHPELRLARVVTPRLAAGTPGAGVGVPVGGPLQDVPRHVDESVAVG